jgi:hypothetical protein
MRDITRTELEFIAQDNIELIQLVLGLRNNKAAGEIGLGLSPFVALFAEESFNYLRAPVRQNSGAALASPLFETFSEAVTKLRARAKLFDDNRGGLERLIETLALAHRKSTEWFLHPHQGVLGKLKRHPNQTLVFITLRNMLSALHIQPFLHSASPMTSS